MRTKLRSKVRLLFMTCAVLLAIPAIALADNFQNTLASSAGGTVTITTDGITAGTTAPIGYRVVGTGGDGGPSGPGTGNCNASDGTPLGVSFNVANVTATPSSLSFTSCGTTQNVTFSSKTPGTYTIDPGLTDTGAGTYTDQSPFTLHVQGTGTSVTDVSGSGTEGLSDGSLSAKLVWNNNNVGGKTISFAIDKAKNGTFTNVGSATTNNTTGVATLSDVSLAGLAPGTYDLKATFAGDNNYAGDDTTGTLTVNSANTAPVVSVTGVNDPSYEIGSEPTPGCSVVDAEDTGESATPVVDRSALSHGLGTVTVTCSYKDGGGLEDSDTVSYTVVDTGDPTASHQLSADANGNGWHRADFTVTLNGSDSGSGVKEIHYTINGGTEQTATGASKVLSINTEGVKDISYFSVDYANNESAVGSVTVRLDKTAPTGVSGSPDSAANANGWYKNPVSFTFTGDDPLSTIDSCSTPTYSGPDGTSKTVSGSCTDKAGNESDSVASSAIKYDATAPVITNVGADSTFSTPNAAGWYKTDVKHEFSASDNLSGFAGGVTTQSIFNTITQEGSAVTTTSGTVTDQAGNVSNSETSPGYKIDKTKPTLNPTVSPNPVLLGETATASAGASDTPGSGIASSSCANPVTNTIGTGLTVSCSATDNAGNTNSANATYSVAAKLDTFLQPIDGNMINAGKVGRVYPVKWQLKNSSNALISDAAAQALIDQNLIKVQQRTMDCSTGEPTDTLETEVAAGSTVVRYDATSDQFVYNYKAPATKGCYNLEVIKADGVNTKSIHFSFTK